MANRRQQMRDASTHMQQTELNEEDAARASCSESTYLDLPSAEERKDAFRAFREATSNAALSMHVCIVCVREVMANQCQLKRVSDIPHVDKHLVPSIIHPGHQLWRGLLVQTDQLLSREENAEGWTCMECLHALAKDRRPKLALANNMWIGEVPRELAMLTLPEELLIARLYPKVYVVKLYPKESRHVDASSLQRAIRGNVTLYNSNTDDVMKMLADATTLITYVGAQKLPKNWLKSTFRVRCRVVHDALLWLKNNNPQYNDTKILNERLAELPEDDVPNELLGIVRQETEEIVANRESATYVPSNEFDSQMFDRQVQDATDLDEQNTDIFFPSEDRGTVIPLQSLGVADVDLHHVELNELMKYGLQDLIVDGRLGEGAYAVRHSQNAATDFGRDIQGNVREVNPLTVSFPTLFPYGEGGFEADRIPVVSFNEHARWSMQYFDRRFRTHHTFPFVVFGIQQKRKAMTSARIQMQRHDFEKIGTCWRQSLLVICVKQQTRRHKARSQLTRGSKHCGNTVR
ncbi:hypothetical protein JVU11DRAFT_9325 [Chiua virens]|nr:hypothetical protein JVU11DRAFT_9325 [Chiua virens]